MNVSDLIEAYVNEKSVPVILKYRKDVVKYFYKMISDQKLKIKNLSVEKNIKNIYELELTRIEYFLKEYIKMRLHKMKNDFFLDKSLLSENEFLFYEKFLNLFKNRNLICENGEKTKYTVGFICKKDLGNVMLDGEVVDMFEDDVFVGPLDDIFEFVIREEIRLI